MLDIQREIENLLRKHPDPRKSNGVAEFETRLFRESCPPTYGIVVDNKDPECLGRLKSTVKKHKTKWFKGCNSRR